MTDYDFLADPGITRISSISASQALRASSSQYQYPSTAAGAGAGASAALPLSTGLDGLDNGIYSSISTGFKGPDSTAISGIPRGSITEIYGPPGVGKTAISLNIAAKILTSGEKEKVTWIDTGSPIPRPRLKELLISNIKKASTTTAIDDDDIKPDYIDKRLNDCMARLCHVRAPSLPHLLSLFAQPPTNFPAEDTAVLIVDSISAPFQSYFPNATELKSRQGQGQAQSRSPEQQQTQWLLNRKWNVTSDMASRIMKLATSRGIAVILLNQTHTKIKGQPRPTLYPALAGGSWENCIHTRIVLYRDWPPPSSSSSALPPSSFVAADRSSEKKGGSSLTAGAKVRYAEIMKKGGKVINVRTEANLFPFVIDDDGLRELRPSSTTTTNNIITSAQQQQQNPQNTIAAPQSSPPPALTQQSATSQSTSTVTVRKRKVDEIADSEDDDDDEFLDGEYDNDGNDDDDDDNYGDGEVEAEIRVRRDREGEGVDT